MPIATALLRGVHLAATLSLLGTAGFAVWMLPAGGSALQSLLRHLRRLWLVSGACAVLAGVAWFGAQAILIAGADTIGDGLAALPLVALHTRFGSILMARVGLLAVATGLGLSAFGGSRTIGLGRWLALVLVVAAVGLQGLIGHAGATVGAIGDGLVVSEFAHLLGAGIWLGALPPLWLTVRHLPPRDAAVVCERFSPVGLACVLLLAGTGLVQGLQLIGGIAPLLGTEYGHFALLKIALFLLALLLAAINRLWLTDRLAAKDGARRQLLMSVAVETVIGLAIVTTAAFMASSPPAAHVQPVWPLSWQFSLVRLNEDADLRRQLGFSLIAIGTSVAMLAGAALWGRLRFLAAALLAAVIVWRAPSLALLTDKAVPTSFQVSPTGFSAASIVRGQAVFVANCTACHGADGNGPAAAGLRIKPANLTAPHIWEHSDGEMFWWVSHGVDSPGGGLAMPGFSGVLPEDDRWSLIDYLRAHSAAKVLRKDRGINLPLRMPAMAIRCPAITGLAGHAVHIVTSDGFDDDVPAVAGVTTVTLDLRDDTEGACVSADPAAWGAFAVLADVPPAELAGTEFLVDPNGFIRAARRPGSAAGWRTKDELIAAIRGICTHPIEQSNGGPHDHHH